jgi:hypothetical protein
MKTEDIRRLATAFQQVTEKIMIDPVDPKQAKGKFADRKDKDIDNDGDTDKSDNYLHNRRKAITKSVEKETTTSETKKEAADLDSGNVDKALKHDCATHVTSEQWGAGQCIKGMHTIEETADGEGIVTHYDVMFEHGIEHDVPVSELNIVRSEAHMHSRNKKMEMSSKEKMKRGLYNSTNESVTEDYGAMKDAEAHAAKNGENYARDTSVQHRYDAYHMKKKGYTHFEPGSYGSRRYTKGPTAHSSSTKIGPEHHKGVSESVQESVSNLSQAIANPRPIQAIRDFLTDLWSEAVDTPFKAKDRGERGTHMKGATEPEAIDSKASGKEKEFTNMHGGLGQKTPPEIVDEPVLDVKNFQAFATSTKKAPMRRGDNPQSDKMQTPADTTKG